MTATTPLRVLVVSEEPAFIYSAGERLRPRGARVMGCLGPAHSYCILEDSHQCPLANHATIALIDSPATGAFTDHVKSVRSGAYAEALQRKHPHCTVILCGAPEGEAGPTGTVTAVASTSSALALLEALVANGPMESGSTTDLERKREER